VLPSGDHCADYIASECCQLCRLSPFNVYALLYDKLNCSMGMFCLSIRSLARGTFCVEIQFYMR